MRITAMIYLSSYLSPQLKYMFHIFTCIILRTQQIVVKELLNENEINHFEPTISVLVNCNISFNLIGLPSHRK